MHYLLKDHLEKLPSILAISEKRSFRKAAESLGLTQPALTRQIAILEEVLGRELFVRKPQGVDLTPAGILMRDLSRGLLNETERVERQLRGGQIKLKGEFRVGTFESLAIRVLPKMIAELRVMYPRLRLDVTTGDNEKILEQVAEGKLHVALGIRPLEAPPELQMDLAFSDSYGFFCSPAFIREAGLTAKPLTLTQVNRMPMALLQSARCATGDSICELLKKKGVRPPTVFRVETFEAAVNYAIAGVGLTVLPYVLAHIALTKRKLVEVETEVFPKNHFGEHEMVWTTSLKDPERESVALLQVELSKLLVPYLPRG